MCNLGTATLKLGIFHPHNSLSQALITATLQRQIEVSALRADLNSPQARPGLRCRPVSLASSIEASRVAAGLDLLFAPLLDYIAEALPLIYAALIDGALRVEVPCLFLPGHWQWLAASRDAGEEQLGVGLERSLMVNGLDWTLVEIPSLSAGLCIDDFSRTGGVTEVEVVKVFACVEALLDEVRLGLYKRQCLHPAP